MATEDTAALLRVNTPALDMAYETGGPADGRAVILLHGWPDDVRTFDYVIPVLHVAGMKTFVPWLRGFGPTRVVSTETARSGQIAAMAQDVLDFAATLGLGRFAIVGHGWGARIAYLLAAVAPERRAGLLHFPWIGRRVRPQRPLSSKQGISGTNGS